MSHTPESARWTAHRKSASEVTIWSGDLFIASVAAARGDTTGLLIVGRRNDLLMFAEPA